MRRRLASALAVVVATAICGAAWSAPARVTLGVYGGLERFDGLTGQHSRTRHVIVGWGQGLSAGGSFAEILGSLGELPMLGLNTSYGGVEMITPGQIAAGRGDDYLVALSRALHAFGKPVFVRPFGEMNGHWTAYCAYNQDGSPRNAAHSTASFRKAFARVYLIVHGGSGIDARLRLLGMPPLHLALERNPGVKVVWNPQGYGSPDVAGNAAQAYYPGDPYVDVVGDDLYDIRFRPQWAATEALYDAHPGKPFSFPEWGLWGVDDPAFVTQMAAFLETHHRTLVAVYYSGRPGSVFDLASKPKSLAAYRKLISPLGG